MTHESAKNSKKAIFIVGYNNWGETTIIKTLFRKQHFKYDKIHSIEGIRAGFCVQSQSNDDVGQAYVDQIHRRLDLTQEQETDVFAALCPSLEDTNNFLTDILAAPVFDIFGEFHFFQLKYKWENHAELLIKNVTDSFNHALPGRVKFFHVVDADEGLVTTDRLQAKINQVSEQLRLIYQ